MYYASAICSQDSMLFYPGVDNSLVVWGMDSQNELGHLVGHDKRITATRGNLTVSAQLDGPPRLWNLDTLQCTATLPDMGDTRSAYCTGGKVLLGSTAGTIKLWDVAASAPVGLACLEGHTDLLHQGVGEHGPVRLIGPHSAAMGPAHQQVCAHHGGACVHCVFSGHGRELPHSCQRLIG